MQNTNQVTVVHTYILRAQLLDVVLDYKLYELHSLPVYADMSVQCFSSFIPFLFPLR